MFSNTWLRIHDPDTNNPFKTTHKTPEPIEGHVSPRVATAYDLDKDTTIKVSYQHGFRRPMLSTTG
jgi:outer membrane receptor protein involved in Fe transport